MKFTYYKYGLSLSLKENYVNVLVIENSNILVDLMQNIYNQTAGNHGDIVLGEEDKILSIAKNVQLILEPFSLDLNEKKIQTQLYHEIKEIAYEGLCEDTAKIHTDIVRYMDKLLSKVPYPITYAEELDMTSLLKMLKVSLQIEAESLLEKIVQYLHIISALCNIKILIFFNLKAFLKEEEIQELYKEAR